MSKTANTTPPDLYALGAHPRDAAGARLLPRIQRRRPRPGDVHPLAPADIRHCLRLLPPAYVYGLRGIELRARRDAVGAPYGTYLRGERRIWLYSCPPRRWRFEPEVWPRHRGLLADGATPAAVPGDPDGVWIEWHDPADLWRVYLQVLVHELGHHYVNQYRASRPRPGTRRRNEAVADLHGERIVAALARRVARHRAGN